MEYKIKKINGNTFADDRGFVRFVNEFDFKGVKRFYQVENHERGLIGTVNLKTEEVMKHTLTSKLPSVLYIPPGFANGFMTLEEDTILMFFSTSTLSESHGDDIRFSYDKWNIWEKQYR